MTRLFKVQLNDILHFICETKDITHVDSRVDVSELRNISREDGPQRQRFIYRSMIIVLSSKTRSVSIQKHAQRLQDTISTAQVIRVSQQLTDSHKIWVGKEFDGVDMP